MYLAYTPEQAELRQELRSYFASVMTPEERRALRNGYSVPEAMDAYRSVIRKLGRDGWLGIGWPVEMGGQGRSMIEQAIFNDEATAANVPTPLLTINSVGPAIHTYGSDEQRRTLVPGILAGELHFAIGYSEPEVGTDLAALRTRAVRDGAEYVINGQKLWTGMMEAADYIWLAVRTDPDAPRHKGISVLLVPRHAPGVHSTRLRTMGDQSVAAVSFEDVRVPLDACIGGENNGWKLMTGQLNSERVALAPAAGVQRQVGELAAWARQQQAADGSRLIDQQWVRMNLAEMTAKVEFLGLLNHKLASDVDRGALAPADASAAKVFSSELMQDVNRLAFEITGALAGVMPDVPEAPLGGSLAKQYRGTTVMTFIGGTNEIQRDLIARLGLGLPRAGR